MTRGPLAPDDERPTDAWLGELDVARILELTERTLPALGPHDVKLWILAVSAEHNVVHAAFGHFIDIVTKHGGRMFPGNAAIGEVVEVGGCVTQWKPGDIVQTHCNGAPDPDGYPRSIWAFDTPDSIGWYCEEAVVGDWQLIRLPLDCGLSLWQLAALPLRAPTAYHLWRRAIGIYRIKVPREKRARLNVLAFGGGVAELFLMLARAEGHAAIVCNSNADKRGALAKLGIVAMAQEQFSRFEHARDIEAFRERCRDLTRGEGMHIVCDMHRGRLFDAGIAVASRQGVNVSAGWQLAQQITYNSALLSVKQITLDHCHYEVVPGCSAVTELYGNVLKPIIHSEIYDFDELPRCFREMHQNKQTGTPIIRVARDLPEAVKRIA